jgi:monoterpene epsilon-lactone hydrolase
MSLNLTSRFWRAFLRKTMKEQRISIAERRAGSAKNARFMNRVPKGVEMDKFEINGIHVTCISPSDADPAKVILHLHGGGYVTGGLDTYQMMCILLAQTLKIKVLLPEYRLAPEHPFPAALDDALSIYHWLLAQGTQPGNIIISGDSAGGGLCLATVLSLRDDGEPLPAAVVCMSPWTDLTLKSQSHITKAKTEVLLRKEVLREWALCYTEDANLTNPLVSPVHADFHGFPPMLIQVGSEEILLDDARMLADKAQADGVDVTLKIWDGLWHVWQALGDVIPENKKAFEEIGRFVQSRFGRNERAG